MTITCFMMKLRRSTRLAALLTAGLVVTGCSGIKSPGSASHAGLTIRGHSYADTVLMARRVFAERGFKVAQARENRMVLERDGSRADQAKYGGWDGSRVSTRIKLDIEELGADIQYLRLDVYSVNDAGNLLEDENRVVMFSARRYQEMLEEVQARLDGTWVPPEERDANE
jgi:hypothetical protein